MDKIEAEMLKDDRYNENRVGCETATRKRKPGDYSWKFDEDCADMILGRPNPITGNQKK